ncbi:carboxymuconolactone decarboxylase, partial [Bifidobacterium animalis]|nr:carboxymuconolactone decarboxylase [Bifidobacterium animalis]
MDALEMGLAISYQFGVKYDEIKEIVYEATPLIGYGNTMPYLKRINDYHNVDNVELPWAPQCAIDKQNRTQQ